MLLPSFKSLPFLALRPPTLLRRMVSPYLARLASQAYRSYLPTSIYSLPPHVPRFQPIHPFLNPGFPKVSLLGCPHPSIRLKSIAQPDPLLALADLFLAFPNPHPHRLCLALTPYRGQAIATRTFLHLRLRRILFPISL